MKLLLVGYNDDVLGALDGSLPDGAVVVLEERDLWEGKRLQEKAARHRCLGDARFGNYQQDDQYLDVVAGLAGIDAVAPGLEYAVVAAARTAEFLGLPGAGSDSAAVLRDKLVLREVTSAAGLAGPAFQEITSPADIAAFCGGGPCVIKPAGRQASVGVLLLDAGADVTAAWRECTQAEERRQLANRPMRWRYLVEEWLRGAEFSTESLVAGGRPVFTNVTAKTTAPGRHPVELGHVVPGVGPGELDGWAAVVADVVRAIGFGTGILHGEWILTADGPALVECAGRPPGDKIMDLIDLAYRTDITHEWVRLLAGEPVRLPDVPVGAAAVHYVTSLAGVIDRIDGVDRVERCPGVVRVDLSYKAGDQVTDLLCSWDRIGSVIATAGTAQEAAETARRAAADVSVSLRPRQD